MPYTYNYQLGWTLTNNTGRSQTLTGFSVHMDSVEYGYWWSGSFQILLNGEQVRTGSGNQIGWINGLSVDLAYFGGVLEVPAGATVKLNAIAENERQIGAELDMSIPDGWTRTPDNSISSVRLGFYVAGQSGWGSTSSGPIDTPTAGGNLPSGGSGSEADISGMEYLVSPPVHDVFAKVTRWSYPPLFGLKVLIPPPAPPQLFYPTTYGPNYEGRCGGMLLLPAIVAGVKDDDGRVRDIECAGVRLTFAPAGSGDISSGVAVGILPYPNGGS